MSIFRDDLNKKELIIGRFTVGILVVWLIAMLFAAGVLLYLWNDSPNFMAIMPPKLRELSAFYTEIWC